MGFLSEEFLKYFHNLMKNIPNLGCFFFSSSSITQVLIFTFENVTVCTYIGVAVVVSSQILRNAPGKKAIYVCETEKWSFFKSGNGVFSLAQIIVYVSESAHPN